MKRKLSITLISLSVITVMFSQIVFGSQDDTSNQSVVETEVEAIKDTVKEAAKEVVLAPTNITADIVKNGEIEDTSIETNSATITLVSWDLGYSGNLLNFGNEELCMKFHIKNNTDQQVAVADLFCADIFIDGVEHASYYTDHYGDGSAFEIQNSTNMRPQSELDLYLCADCKVEGKHLVEVDIHELLPMEEATPTNGQYSIAMFSDMKCIGDVLTTFSFDIPE